MLKKVWIVWVVVSLLALFALPQLFAARGMQGAQIGEWRGYCLAASVFLAGAILLLSRDWFWEKAPMVMFVILTIVAGYAAFGLLLLWVGALWTAFWLPQHANEYPEGWRGVLFVTGVFGISWPLGILFLRWMFPKRHPVRYSRPVFDR